MGVSELARYLAIASGSAGLGATARELIRRHYARPVEQARAAQIDAESAAVRARTAADEITTARELMSEVRAEVQQLRGRVSQLEERERHMLTRAAVHEAWDQMSFALLVGMHPEHPPPPPLMPPRELESDPDNRDAYGGEETR